MKNLVSRQSLRQVMICIPEAVTAVCTVIMNSIRKVMLLRIICDNHSAHKFKGVRNYLASRPEGRFVFVFTPTHGLWLNLIESFFSKMTKQMLRGIRVNSKEELENRIYQYFDEVNREPVV